MYNKVLDNILFEKNDIDRAFVTKLVENTLHGLDDGELFMEVTKSENLTFDDGKLKLANSENSSGFGLRSVSEDVVCYAHSSEISKASLSRAANTIKSVRLHSSANVDLSPNNTNKRYYNEENPIAELPFSEKIKTLKKIDDYARNKSTNVKQVSASLISSWQGVRIIRADGRIVDDIRPLVRLNINIAIKEKNRMETGSYGSGGRHGYNILVAEENWKKHVDEAYRQAEVMINAKSAPAGEMTVVLGPGWPGILLHEAIGHGLEGDFNRKKTSVFSNLLGKKVASTDVNVVDDGTIDCKRGSLTIDDEGTPTEKTVLIENGIITGYMQDRLNARLMKSRPTGNGRRQSFAFQPMPRMRNTIMTSGDKEPEEILKSVKKGIFAKSFAGGQVDITNGKFVFSANEAYKIENGKITHPVKGATLIGSGFEVLKNVSMIGNDMQLDPGIGTCGKNGQGVPVGVGQPTLKINGLTVGGTETHN